VNRHEVPRLVWCARGLTAFGFHEAERGGEEVFFLCKPNAVRCGVKRHEERRLVWCARGLTAFGFHEAEPEG
jgi:hypothetical protein